MIRKPKCRITQVYAIGDGNYPRYYWSLVAPNGRVVADGSEGYSSVASAKRGFINAMNLGEYADFVVVKPR